MAFTYFFRDVQTLEMLRDYALPYLKTRRYINIWDAGCAMGPEPYTLAMLFRENMGHMYFRNLRINATDIDGSDLFKEIIEEGNYPWEQLERIPGEIFKKYFTKSQKDGYFTIVENIRKSIKYQKHDLLSLKPVGKDFGIIVCKNVLLHFNEYERINVIKMFHDSLIDGGYFVIEQTQKLPLEVEHLFERVVSNAQLFKKR